MHAINLYIVHCKSTFHEYAYTICHLLLTMVSEVCSYVEDEWWIDNNEGIQGKVMVLEKMAETNDQFLCGIYWIDLQDVL